MKVIKLTLCSGAIRFDIFARFVAFNFRFVFCYFQVCACSVKLANWAVAKTVILLLTLLMRMAKLQERVLHDIRNEKLIRHRYRVKRQLSVALSKETYFQITSFIILHACRIKFQDFTARVRNAQHWLHACMLPVVAVECYHRDEPYVSCIQTEEMSDELEVGRQSGPSQRSPFFLPIFPRNRSPRWTQFG
jgi:hypothetical protein